LEYKKKKKKKKNKKKYKFIEKKKKKKKKKYIYRYILKFREIKNFYITVGNRDISELVEIVYYKIMVINLLRKVENIFYCNKKKC